MKTKLPMLAGTAALSALIGLIAGCADGSSGAKTNNVKVAQYVEDAIPVVREPLPGLPVQGPDRTRDLESSPANDAPVLMADAGNTYMAPSGSASGYGYFADGFSNGVGSARGAVGRGGRGGSGGFGVAGGMRVAAADGGPRGSVAGAAKAGQSAVGQNLAVGGDGEQLIAALDSGSSDGSTIGSNDSRSDFNGLVPRTGTSGAASDTPSPSTSGAGLPAAPAAPKPPVVNAPTPANAPPPIVASADTTSGAPAPSSSGSTPSSTSSGSTPSAPSPDVAPGTPAPAVSAGVAPPPVAPTSGAAPGSPAPTAAAPPIVADLTPPAAAGASPDTPAAGQPGSGAQVPSITSLPLSPDALLPVDMEMPYSADNSGIDGGPIEGPEVTQIPSPATALLMLAGFAGMGWVRRRAR